LKIVQYLWIVTATTVKDEDLWFTSNDVNMANFIHNISIRYHFPVASYDPINCTITRVVEHKTGMLFQHFSFQIVHYLLARIASQIRRARFFEARAIHSPPHLFQGALHHGKVFTHRRRRGSGASGELLAGRVRATSQKESVSYWSLDFIERKIAIIAIRSA
jgi:hypothetical protein